MQKRAGQFAEGLLCIALVMVAVVLAYGSLWRSGSVPFDLSSTLSLTPWQEARPAGEVSPIDIATVLQAKRYFPWYTWLNQGTSTLWNNSEGLGAPFLAAWRTRALSPFSLPVYFLPLAQALVLSAMLKALVAGLAAYYAARRFAFPPPTALLAAVTYALGAPFLVQSPDPLSDLLPWLPLLMVFAERVVLGQWAAWPLGAMVLGLMALGGEPHGFLMVLLALLVYVGVRAATDLRAPSTPRALVATGLAVTLGAALAAAQLLPYYELTLQGDTELGPTLRLGLNDLLAVLHPGLATGLGHPNPSLGALLHVGLAPLLLLPLWLAVREFAQPSQRGRVEVLAGIALIGTLVAVLAGPLLQQSLELDGPGAMHFLLFNAWAFALLGAAAAQEWLELTIDETRIALSRLTKLLPAIWGVLLVGAAIAIAIRGEGGWGSLGLVVLVALAIFALLAVTVVRPNARLLSYGLALISAMSLLACMAPVRPSTRADLVFPETTVVKSLQKIGGRIGGSPRMQEWPLAANGVQQVFQSSGLLLNRLREFLARVQVDPLLMRRTGAQGLLLTTEDIRGAYAGVRPVLNIRDVLASGAILFRDNEALPRARMVYAGRRTEKYAPDQVRSDAPPVMERSTLPEKDDGPVAKVALMEESPARLVFKVDKTRPAVLVIADAWYPGWHATVDGAPAEVVRVDGVFRGVELGEGEHDVILEYVPTMLHWGIAISALGALIVAAGLWRFALQSA